MDITVGQPVFDKSPRDPESFSDFAYCQLTWIWVGGGCLMLNKAYFLLGSYYVTIPCRKNVNSKSRR